MALSKEKSFDMTDYRIIALLRENARMPEEEISAKTGAGVEEVRSRINRLLKAGAGRITMVVDPDAFGYKLAADIYLSLDKTREKEIIEELRKKPNVTYMGHGQEAGEIALEVRFKSSSDLYDFVKTELPSIPGVIIEEFTMLPRILKNIDQWVPPEEDFTPS